MCCMFFFQAEDGIRDLTVTGVQTCALPISTARRERRDVVERRTVVKPHDEGDQPGPDEPVERRRAVATLHEDIPERRRHADQDQRGDGPLADGAVMAPEEGVADAAPANRPPGEKVQRRTREPAPRPTAN